jgi:pimeloyl-ACP methyl ester carboxylesterase
MSSHVTTRLAGALLAGLAVAPLPSEPPPPPAPRFADVRLSTGIRMHYAEQGDPRGEVVILLHGYSDSWFSYSRVLPLLSDRYRVYALDLRGHGRSDRPATGYHMRDLAADVIAFMDAKGIVRASVVGHSMGSFVAQQVALTAPRRVSRLVLVASATTVRNVNGASELKLAVDSLSDPFPESFVREFQVSTIHVPAPEEFMNGVVSESLKLPARVWRELIAGMLATDPPLALGRAGIPTLVIWGDRDAYMQRGEQDALVRMLKTATLTVYRDTGHAPHWERPQAFVRDLHGFLQRPAS